MAHVALFHSVYGRRPAVLAAADRLRAAGHTVTAPDLYGGRLAATAEAGFALCDQVGWQTIMRRARQALAGWPPETVLAGLSMGASVAWRGRCLLFDTACRHVPKHAGQGSVD